MKSKLQKKSYDIVTEELNNRQTKPNGYKQELRYTISKDCVGEIYIREK